MGNPNLHVLHFHILQPHFINCFMHCRTPVLDKASKAVWDLILDSGGLGKEITETNRKGARAVPNGCDTELHDESEITYSFCAISVSFLVALVIAIVAVFG